MSEEYEDKPSLYKALRGLISGEEFVNPYRFGETSFAQNPKKFIDRTDPNYQESIYAEPAELPSMDTGGIAGITKREAVKMLAKTGISEKLGSIVRDSVISTPEKSINATHWSKGKIKGDFDFNRLGEVTQGNNPQATESAKLGAWFTESNEAISSSHKVPNKAELALKNPLVLTNENAPEVDVMGSKLKDAKQWLMDEIEKLGGGNKLRDKLKKQGYDGIILDDSEFNNAKSYIVFDKTQMKFID